MKRFVLLMTLITAVLTVSAQVISREKARIQAEQFFQQRGISVTLQFVPSKARGKNSSQLEGVADYYVFNADSQQGFVVMAADSRMPQPVLAYSLHGSLDPESMNGPVKDWLATIEKQMEWLRASGSQAPSYRAPARKAIPQLLSTKWNQVNPYNSRIPGGCLTGCGATAMAQVMNFYRYPNAVQAAIPSYTTITKKISIGGVAAGSAIDWGNMIDDYSIGSPTASQKKAVADLMLFCGTSVQMDYTTEFSGSSLESIGDALKKYFGYYPGIRMRYHEEMSNSAWDDLIYSELDAGRPVMISGKSAQSGGTGHIFICDGYDGSGHYHINWGWGGYQDAFFVLSNLTPPDDPPGYNFWQGCVTGVKPDDGTFSEQVVLTTIGFQLLDINTGEPTTQTEYVRPPGSAQFPVGYGFQYKSNLANVYHFDVNLGVFQDGKLVEVLFDGNGFLAGTEITNSELRSFGAGYLPRSSFNTTFLSPGTYVLKVVSRQTGTTEWLENEGSDQYCLVCVIDNKMKMTCSIGLSSVTPEPGPDEPEIIPETERTNLAYNIGQLVSTIDLKMTNLNDEKTKHEALYANAQKAVNAYEALRKQYEAIRQQVQQSSLSDAVKQTFYNYIDNALSVLGGEWVEEAAKKALALSETAISSMENELVELNQILSYANVLQGQAASETDLTAFNKVKTDYQTLYNSYVVHQSFTTSAELQQATNLLNVSLNNMSVVTNNYPVSYLEEQLRSALDNAAIQQRIEEVNSKVQDARDKLVELTEKLNNTRNAVSDLAENHNQTLSIYSSLVDQMNVANQMLSKANLNDNQREKLTQQQQDIRNRINDYESLLGNVKKKVEELNSQMIPVSEQNSLVQTFNAIFADFHSATTNAALTDVENRLVNLSADMNQAASKNEAFCETLAALKPDIESLKEPLNELENTIKVFKDAIQNAEQEYLSEQEELYALKKKLTEEFDLLKQQMETIQADFSKRVSLVEEIEYACNEKQEAREELLKLLEKIEESLSSAVVSEENRDALTADYQTLLDDLKKAQQAEDEMEEQLRGSLLVSIDVVHSLVLTYNELVSKYNDASTKEELDELSGLCEALSARINEVEGELASERENLSDVKDGVHGLLSNADELAKAISTLNNGIEKAVKEELEKQLLEIARQEQEALLVEVKNAAEKITDEIAKIKSEAQVLSGEDDVKQLLDKLNVEEKHLSEIKADLKIQNDAMSSAATMEELSSIGSIVSKYMTELQSMEATLKNLHTQLQAVLTVLSPLTIDGKKIVGCYDTNGRPTDIRKKGLKILHLSDGTTRKVYIK